VRRAHPELGFRPDAKSQVTVGYVEGKPQYIDTVVFSAQHDETLTQADIAARVKEHVIRPVLNEYAQFDRGNIKYHINPTGKFVIGGPQADTGLTGRKIIVDTYGGYARHGGGAFSGKDPSKVDRSAAYMARYCAKNIVAAGLAEKCEIQIAYAIGVAKPVSVFVETFGTHTVDPQEISRRLQEAVDLRPGLIIEHLGLLDRSKVCYRDTARNGHFGKPHFPWERTDLVDRLR
jgi:S-adenosylmethionine synthetase